MPEEQEEGDSQRVRIHYIKAPNYETRHADGAFGGLTPAGKILITFYLDRGPIPKSLTYEITDGALGDIVEKDSRDGFIREVGTGVVMDLNSARGLRDWLDDKIKQAEREIIEGGSKNEHGDSDDG